MKKGLILFIIVIISIIIHSSFIGYYKNFIESKLDMNSYGFVSKAQIMGIGDPEDPEEFKKYCEGNMDKCKNIIFKHVYYNNEDLIDVYYELPIFFGKKCYSNFNGGDYDSKWRNAYHLFGSLEQFYCYGMLDGGGFPGYPVSFSILFFVSLLVYGIGKIFKKDMLISIGKYIFITQIVLIILVIVIIIVIGIGLRGAPIGAEHFIDVV